MLSPSLPKLSNTCTLVHLYTCTWSETLNLLQLSFVYWTRAFWSQIIFMSSLKCNASSFWFKKKTVIIMSIVVKHGINSQISKWWWLLLPCYAPERWTISLIHARELEILFRNKQNVIWLQRVLHLSLAQQFSSIFLSMYRFLATFMFCKKKYWNLRTSWYITGVSPHSAGPGLRSK